MKSERDVAVLEKLYCCVTVGGVTITIASNSQPPCTKPVLLSVISAVMAYFETGIAKIHKCKNPFYRQVF